MFSYQALNFLRPSLTTRFSTDEKLTDFGDVLIIFACIPRSFSTFVVSNTTVIRSPTTKLQGFAIKERPNMSQDLSDIGIYTRIILNITYGKIKILENYSRGNGCISL